MSFVQRIDGIVERHDRIAAKLVDYNSLSPKELAELSKEQSDLQPIVDLAIKYKDVQRQIKALEEEKFAATEEDREFKQIVEDELADLRASDKKLYDELRILLLPKNKDDERNVIVEIRAGTGGDEAALFASALLKMYIKYAERKRWKYEILSITTTGLDGCKEVSISITGKDVFYKMKFESGVHRVQRVPETESSGRIHTSAATVAVLPEVEEVDIKIDSKDIKIDVFRASGAGGQHVNTTDSAVRITHIPSGIVVSQQDEKSQHKNKAKAMKILLSRIYDMEKSQANHELSEMRKEQVGSGDRSQRIRTYNYSQNRVTDHRINLTLYALSSIISDGDLDKVIDPLIADARMKQLSAME